jgi:hypothetical protein
MNENKTNTGTGNANNNSPKMFLRRRSDGKFYRGAKLWKWCKSWRHAAVLQHNFWNGFVTPNIEDQYDLLTLDDIET